MLKLRVVDESPHKPSTLARTRQDQLDVSAGATKLHITSRNDDSRMLVSSIDALPVGPTTKRWYSVAPGQSDQSKSQIIGSVKSVRPLSSCASLAGEISTGTHAGIRCEGAWGDDPPQSAPVRTSATTMQHGEDRALIVRSRRDSTLGYIGSPRVVRRSLSEF
jgi:hypothetical protein